MNSISKLYPLFALMFFAIAAIVTLVAAPLLPTNMDTAYSFFRLMQNVPLNLDDLRTLNVFTWLFVKTGVVLHLDPKALSYLLSLGTVVSLGVLFFVSKYIFKYKKSLSFFALFLLTCTINLIYPTSSWANSSCFMILAFTLSRGERKMPKLLLYSLLAFFLLMAIIVEPLWIIGIAFWLITEAMPCKTITDTISCEPSSCKVSLVFRILLLLALSAVAITLQYIYPPLLTFTLPGYLNAFGFKNVLGLWLSSHSLSVFLLWAGFAYLLLRYLCRRQFAKMVSICFFTVIYLVFFALKPNFGVYYTQSLISFWLVLVFFIMDEKQKLPWFILCALFCVLSWVSNVLNIHEKTMFYDEIYQAIPKNNSKILGYGVELEGSELQPSAIPTIEMLNFSFIKYNNPKIVLFKQPNVKPLNPYEADLSLYVTPTLFWNYIEMNPVYFEALFPKGNVYSFPKNIIPFTTIYDFTCDTESYKRHLGGRPFFVCKGLCIGFKNKQTDGPRFVEDQTTARAFSGGSSVFVLKERWETFQTIISVEERDSLYLSVLRLGKGVLSVEKFEASSIPNKDITFYDQASNAVERLAAPSDSSTLWDRLELNVSIPSGISKVLIRVKTESGGWADTSYFDDLKVTLKRSGYHRNKK